MAQMEYIVYAEIIGGALDGTEYQIETLRPYKVGEIISQQNGVIYKCRDCVENPLPEDCD